VIDSNIGIYCEGALIAKNNIVQGCNYNYNSYLRAPSDYNISDLNENLTGSHNKTATSVAFVDAANKDFHLHSLDSTAGGAGACLLNDDDISFSDDIDGDTRGGTKEGLVLWQTFNAAHIDWTQSGAEARDISNQANHGAIHGATVADGYFGQAMQFDGSSNYLIINDSANQTLGNQLTVSGGPVPAQSGAP